MCRQYIISNEFVNNETSCRLREVFCREVENMYRISVEYNKKPCYDIVLSVDFRELSPEIAALDKTAHRICIITDENVKKLYGEVVSKALSESAKELYVYAVPAGEMHKTLDTVKEIYRFLIEHKFDRNDILVALGGGVIGDITGFAAATYLRGIDFIQIPTTLLAQVDSSIGGKTGVDFDGFKNMVGAFKMPRLVYMNLQTLQTLDDRQFYSGFAEAMKHGLIKDSSYYEWILYQMYEICERVPEVLRELVYRSCMIKKAVVEKDPLEKGDRALLNFGHTIGHAIEKNSGFSLLHGECVALGCVAAAYISRMRGLLSTEEYYEIRDMFVPFSLPISVTDIRAEEILELIQSDKKMSGGQITFVLLKKIGKAFLDRTVTQQELLAGIKEIIYRDEMDEATDSHTNC